MEEIQPYELKEKFENFLINNLEEKIEDSLIIRRENIEVIILERPKYDSFLRRRYYTKGLIQIGRKYYPLVVAADKYYIFIKSKPFSIRISWEELEGGNQ